jgi:hypothetical protein
MIALLLGHRRIKSTARHIHLDDRDEVRAVDEMQCRGSKKGGGLRSLLVSQQLRQAWLEITPDFHFKFQI